MMEFAPPPIPTSAPPPLPTLVKFELSEFKSGSSSSEDLDLPHALPRSSPSPGPSPRPTPLPRTKIPSPRHFSDDEQEPEAEPATAQPRAQPAAELQLDQNGNELKHIPLEQHRSLPVDGQSKQSLAKRVGSALRSGWRSLQTGRHASYELNGDPAKFECRVKAFLKNRKRAPAVLPEAANFGYDGDHNSISLLIICVTLPIMYNNVQTTIDYVENEMRFCERSNREALVEVDLGRQQLKSNRTARSAAYGGYGSRGENSAYDNENAGGSAGGDEGGYANDNQAAPILDASVTGSPIQTECPGCCIPGPPGPRGPSGTPGKPGVPGAAGKPGFPGTSPNQTCPMQIQREPPPCRPCPKGPPGIKGWPGFPGDVGPMGPHGEKGRDGEDGQPGETGPQGPPGFRGGPGAPGDKGETPKGEVREGPPGDQGPIGPIGAPGVPGLPGRNGLTGAQGDRGWPGHPGEGGEPGYPGPEGAPGAQGPPGEPGTCVCQNVDSLIVVSAQPNQPRIPEQQETAFRPGFGGGGYGRL